MAALPSPFGILDPGLLSPSSCVRNRLISALGGHWEDWGGRARGWKVLTVSFVFTETKLVVKGCSNISNSTCQFLSTENRVVGGVLFQKFECVDNFSISSTPIPTLTTTTDTGSKVSFTPLALVSFLLLGLVLWDLHPQTLPYPI